MSLGRSGICNVEFNARCPWQTRPRVSSMCLGGSPGQPARWAELGENPREGGGSQGWRAEGQRGLAWWMTKEGQATGGGQFRLATVPRCPAPRPISESGPVLAASQHSLLEIRCKLGKDLF